MITINIWIVEDDTAYRRTLKELLNSEEGLACARVFSDCASLFEAVATEPHPDLLLMDLGLPGMDGVEGIRKLAEIAPNITVVVLTVSEDKNKVVEALNAGAAGYLLKTATGTEIVMGLREVFMGRAVLSPAVAKIVLEEMQKPKGAEICDLTKREMDILQLLASDYSVKEIADQLDLSINTVTFHFKNLYKKLEVQSQSGAVAKAFHAGILKP